MFLSALPALFLPAIIVGGIRTGAFSATEAAAVAVAYAFVIGILYRELRFSAMPDILFRTALDTTLVMVIVGAASLVGYVLTIERIPATIAMWFSDTVTSTILLLLLINLLLLFVGCFLDGGSAIIVFTPVLLPVIKVFGIDPLFFGVMMSINLMIGTITPPVGLSLYVAGYRRGSDCPDDARHPALPGGAPVHPHDPDDLSPDHPCLAQLHLQPMTAARPDPKRETSHGFQELCPSGHAWPIPRPVS